MSDFRFGDVLRLSDDFLANLDLTKPDPYRVMYVGPSRYNGEFIGFVVADRSVLGHSTYTKAGKLSDLPLSRNCFMVAE